MLWFYRADPAPGPVNIYSIAAAAAIFSARKALGFAWRVAPFVLECGLSPTGRFAKRVHVRLARFSRHLG